MHDLFHVPENYFLSHSVGCLPKSTETYLTDKFFTSWISGENWTEWMPVIDEFRAGVGALLSVDKMTICPQINVSSALTKIIYSLPKQTARQTILLSKQDFSTIGYVMQQAVKVGYEIRFVENDICGIDNWERAMDETTAIVHITHALSNTSHLLPVEKICALARANNAVSIVDMAQSLGAVAVDLNTWRPDFAIGSGVKFLCFGPGASFLYVSENILPQCSPLDVGWFSHESPFEMDIEQFRFAKDAMRFFGGTPSPIPFVLGNNALNLWQYIGLDEVYTQIQSKLSYLCYNLAEDVIVSPTKPQMRGATLVINPKEKDILQQLLKRHNIHCDKRQEGYRFSIHAYTADHDVENLSHILSRFKS